MHFPTFPGPAIRGGLGDDRDLHARLFAPPPTLPQKRFADPPRPVMLRPRFGAGSYAEGSALEVDVTLVGSAGAATLPLVRAFARLGNAGVGLGRGGVAGTGRFELERVQALSPVGWAPVLSPDGFLRPVVAPWRLPNDLDAPLDGAEGCTLHLCSPTHVRRGTGARGSLELGDMVDDLLQRVSLLAQAYGDGAVYPRVQERQMVERAREARIEDAALRWTEVPRYSRRQGRPMTFEGWMGWVRYTGPVGPLVPLLRAGELLHVGRHATFGLGEVRLEV